MAEIKELLEYLRIQTDCEYISDLRGSHKLNSIRNALHNVDACQYSIQEWNDAVSYITKQSISFLKAEEAEDYLIHLTRNPGGEEKANTSIIKDNLIQNH